MSPLQEALSVRFPGLSQGVSVRDIEGIHKLVPQLRCKTRCLSEKISVSLARGSF